MVADVEAAVVLVAQAELAADASVGQGVGAEGEVGHGCFLSFGGSFRLPGAFRAHEKRTALGDPFLFSTLVLFYLVWWKCYAKFL
jgi:hypothetical protein